MIDKLQKKITERKHVISVIGLGYVGLPLIDAICKQGIKAIGFDVDDNKVKNLHNGISYIDGVDGASIQKYVDADLFHATTDFKELRDSDVILICVPTPLDKNEEPDLGYVIRTTESIADNLQDGQLIILESTTYPGTVADVMQPILDVKAQAEGVEYYLAYSPEREDPGNQNFSTSSTPKIVGADTDDVLKTASMMYEQFIKSIVSVPSIKVAEAAKITENIFRAVNIALVNELKVVYDNMGIDIWDVVDAAKTKPFGFMPFYPGPGIGGHCIPIDPIYLSWKAKQSGRETKFIELSSEINQSMTDYICNKLQTALEVTSENISGKKVLIIGVAYKKNVKDQRESPAFPLMQKLLDEGVTVSFHDPYIENIMPSRQYPQFNDQPSSALSEEFITSQDAVIIVTDHDNVDYDLIGKHASVIVDTRNALKRLDISCSGKVVKA